ncbi:MAG TPA: 2-dehydropantoate 2-reductase, partial [Alphaproteobacteria bacterium]|nr:2-dehydropantoate 2-reductase [Alphaproteobacteria bacterium]
MEIVVLGAGALGSIITGHLARAGESVSLIARGDRARFLQQNGVTVTGLNKFNASCPVITDANALSGG